MSRDLTDLHPKVQKMAEAFLAKCRAEGIDVLVTCTYRTPAEQNALFARGRTILTENGQKVKIVTNAKAGESAHQYKLALDCVPLRNGKPVWGSMGADLLLWMRLGDIGESVGLEWAGRWVKFKELAHFQWLNGLTIKDLQAGKSVDQ